MKTSEKRRRIEAGRPKLIAELTAMRLRSEPGAAPYLRRAIDPKLKYSTFQAVCRALAEKRKHDMIWLEQPEYRVVDHDTLLTGRNPTHSVLQSLPRIR